MQAESFTESSRMAAEPLEPASAAPAAFAWTPLAVAAAAIAALVALVAGRTAEPVAALYQQGRVRHVGALPELEDEMCDFGMDGLSAGRSPDRPDALVWALTALMLDEAGEPQIRRM